tara:strand:- start:671 stop:1159 length:489 start_codon:yes stop_codon:yes gene_type:complete
MAHSVTIKMNKSANEFQAGDGVGFNVRGGVQYYDRKTKSKEWTNYSAVIFAKAPAQIDFYRSALVEGAIVELGSKQLKIDIYEGNNGPIHSVEMVDAWIGSINQSAQKAPQQQGVPQYQQPQQVPQQQQQSPQNYQQPQQQQQAPQQPQQGFPQQPQQGGGF